MRRATLLAAALLVGACGDGSSPAAPGPPPDLVPLVGETDQGLRMEVDVVGDDQLELYLPADCTREGDDGDDYPESRPAEREYDPVTVSVEGDGSFGWDDSYVVDVTAGVQGRADLRVEGTVRADSSVSGSFEVTSLRPDGRDDDLRPSCRTGEIEFTAARPARGGDDLDLASALPVHTGTAGPDLLLVSETGEGYRVSPDGDVRLLDGTAAELPPPEEPDPAAGGADASSAVEEAEGVSSDSWSYRSEWLGTAVVDDGIWMLARERPGIVRTELADGEQSAAVEEPMETVTAGDGVLWTIREDGDLHELQQRDARTGEVIARTAVVGGILAPGPDVLWNLHRTWGGEPRLQRIDPDTLEADSFDIELPIDEEEVVATPDQVVVLTREGLTTFDAASRAAGRINLPTDPEDVAVAADGESVLTMHPRERAVRRIEGDQVVCTMGVPAGSWRITVAEDDGVWLTGHGENYRDERLVRLDPTTTC